jgi:hypothetical protein
MLMRLPAWIGKRKLATNPLCEEVGDLGMTRNGLCVARLRVLKVRVPCPLCAARNRAGEDAGEGPQASSDDDEFLFGVWRKGTQGLLPSVVQDEGDCLTKVSQAFFTRFPLAVRPGHLGAIRNVPRAILLHDRSELVMHTFILPLTAESNLYPGTFVRSSRIRTRSAPPVA